MGFQPPTFILNVNIWPGTANLGDLPRVQTTGNLSPGRRTTVTGGLENPATGTHLLVPPLVELLLPKGTDVRSNLNTGTSPADVVEVPAGTGRYYVVLGVDDVGKGFTNEYRICWMMAAINTARLLGSISGNLARDWVPPYP